MKTTIELPDALAAEARRIARDQGVTLREVIVSGLRAELERRTAPSDRAPFRFTTFSGSGLRPGIDPARLAEYAYNLPPA
jgi:hypothetical protein